MARRFDRIGWAFAQDGLTSPQKFVLVVLADAANERGITWLKHATIAERCALGVSTVRAAIDFLIEEELLRKGVRYDKNGRQTSNYYQLGCIEPDDDDPFEGARSEHPQSREGARSEQGEVPGASTSYVNQPEASDQIRKKTSSSPSSRTRRSRTDDGPDQSKLDAINDELRPGTRPQQTRRVTRSRKSPTEHVHNPTARNAGGLACYWARELEKVGSLEPSEEAIIGRSFKVWLERGLDVNLARAMIDLFFDDPELVGSTHRWRRFVANSETIRQRVLVNHGTWVPGVDDKPQPFVWIDSLPPALREIAMSGEDVA